MNRATFVMDNLARLYACSTLIVQKPFNKVSEILVQGLRLFPKAMPYDDKKAEFYGGPMAKLISNNYEKSLRLLWKAEILAPYLEFHDASPQEKAQIASLPQRTGVEVDKLASLIDSAGFVRLLQKHFTKAQREALARMLSIILHGEAYALYVSATLLPFVKGTGAKLGMAMQVMEEAKHFIVMRALVNKIDRIYPQGFWEMFLLESILRARPTDRLFGMNVVVESVAMSFFSTFASFPALDRILAGFHLDESRHTAFPQTYLKEVPLSYFERYSPVARIRRTNLIFPLAGLLLELEGVPEKVGIDIFEFGMKCGDKVARLAERDGYHLAMPRDDLLEAFNIIFNMHLRVKQGRRWKGYVNFLQKDTISVSQEMRQLEDEMFGTSDKVFRTTVDKWLNPFRKALFKKAQSFVSQSLN